MSEKNISNRSFCSYFLCSEQLSTHALSTTYSNSENACHLENNLKIHDDQTQFQEQDADGPVPGHFVGTAVSTSLLPENRSDVSGFTLKDTLIHRYSYFRRNSSNLKVSDGKGTGVGSRQATNDIAIGIQTYSLYCCCWPQGAMFGCGDDLLV